MAGALGVVITTDVSVLGQHAQPVYMDGTIAYILIYSRALSAGEIAQNYGALQTLLAPRGILLP